MIHFFVFLKTQHKKAKITLPKKFDLTRYQKKLIKLKKIFFDLLNKKAKFGIHGANFGVFNILFY